MAQEDYENIETENIDGGESSDVYEYEDVVDDAPNTIAAKPKKNRVDDLFEAPKSTDNDMMVDHLFRVSEEDVFGKGGRDMSDLTTVTFDDIMYGGQRPKPKKKVIRRLVRRVPRGSENATRLGGTEP